MKSSCLHSLSWYAEFYRLISPRRVNVWRNYVGVVVLQRMELLFAVSVLLTFDDNYVVVANAPVSLTNPGATCCTCRCASHRHGGCRLLLTASRWRKRQGDDGCYCVVYVWLMMITIYSIVQFTLEQMTNDVFIDLKCVRYSYDDDRLVNSVQNVPHDLLWWCSCVTDSVNWVCPTWSPSKFKFALVILISTPDLTCQALQFR